MTIHRPIRQISFENGIGNFRVVTDTETMGRALLEHCDGTHPAFVAAAKALLEYQAGKGDAEAVRAGCIAALSGAGLFVKDDGDVATLPNTALRRPEPPQKMQSD